MKSPYTLTLTDDSATLESVGGKGLSLAKMAKAGMPVPNGYHITTEAYRTFIETNHLQIKILNALKDVDTALPATLETASVSISKFFSESKIPEDLATAITDAYLTLDTTHVTLPVAVRSSATAEDLPEASFAGQQETYLNIHGDDAVLDAVKKCWASLWTARAIAYRIKNNIDQNTVALAVVVQEMVNAEAAGILFTANPMNGHRDEMVINAAWGLGEAIVGGLVSPDTIIADKATGKVKQMDIAEKTVITVQTENGTAEKTLNDSRRNSQVMKEAQVVELVNIARKIESFYGKPQDIEWCRADDHIYIVQSRPITSLPEPPLVWTLPHPKAVLARGSFAEFVPEPISPLFATLAVPIAREETLNLMSEIGVTDKDSYLFAVINDYVYVGMTFTPRMAWQMTKASFQLLGPIIRTSAQRAAAAREQFLGVVQKWRARDVSTFTPSELLDGVREIFTETAKFYNMAQSGTIPTSMTTEMIFGFVYKLLMKRKEDPKPEVFVFGTDNHAMRSEKALFDIAAWAQTQPTLMKYLAGASVDEIFAVLQADLKPDATMEEFATRFDAYLREYGHAIYDLDFAKPTPADDPMPLIETLKIYLTGKNNPYERQRAALDLREKAAERISKRIDPLRRKWFLKLLKWAQDTAHLREDSIADLGLGHPQMRRMLREFGRRLVAGDAIADVDDVFWLEAKEVDVLAFMLEKNETLKSHTSEIENRKSKWLAMRKIVPPNTLPEKTWMSKFYADNAQTGDVIKGFGASAGKVTARACVMLGPEDFDKMQPGDVIVAGITTPAWTPLFARAAGIVTDIGGPLSHSSIVAREYGIPAVLATAVATRRIQDGQAITVDGSAGTVTLHETKSKNGKELEWTLPDPKGVYMRTSIADLMPKPLSTLFATMGVPTLRYQMNPMAKRLIGGNPDLGEYYFTDINTYAYMNSKFPARGWLWIVLRMLPAYPGLIRGMVSIWRNELHPEYQAFVNSKKKLLPAQMSVDELWRETQSLFDAAAFYMDGLMFATMGAAAGSEMLLTRTYNKLAKKEGDPDATILLMGWDNIPIRSEKSLYNIATWTQADKNLTDYILDTPALNLIEKLDAADSVSVPTFSEFARRLKNHVDTFGHVVFQLDFAEDLPRDHPEMMIETIKMYLHGLGINPHERQQASARKRIETTETMLNRLKGMKRWLFRTVLKWAQSLSEVREDALAEMGLAYPKMRELLRELGQRFVKAGAIEQAKDIFWLEKGEINTSVEKIERNQILDSLSLQVNKRKAFHEKISQITPPPMIPMKERVMGFKSDIFIAQSEEAQTGDILKGVPASAGKVTAHACVLRGPEDFDQMRPGDVLIAGTTTPAWTPLFAMASAVVTDIGGPLSHGSIVAREYGIPAVMGTGVATRRIQSGQVITVDGTKGEIILATREGDQPNKPLSVEWTRPNPKATYARGSLAEHLPNAVSPLFGTLGLRAVNKATAELSDLMGIDVLEAEYQYRAVNGYVYMGFLMNFKFALAMIRLAFTGLKFMLTGGKERWLETRKTMANTIAKWDEKNPEALSAFEILEGVRELMYLAGKYYTIIQSGTLPSASTSEIIFTNVYKIVKRKGDPDASTLLFGLETVPLKAEKSLFDLGMWIRENPALRKFALHSSTVELVAALQAESTPEALPAADWREFKSRFKKYLDEFGHTSYEFDFMNPTPAETLEVILDALKVYAEGSGSDPYARQREVIENRNQTVERIRNRFKLIPNRWFDKSLKWAMDMGPAREDSIADMGMGHTTIRRLLGELGKRITANGAFDNAENIYWLTEEEVDQLASLLEHGESLPNYSARVFERKTTWHEQMKLTPPPLMPETSLWSKLFPWSKENASENVIKGLGASKGKVTATARLLFGPEDFSKMKQGDVLVAVITTPAWTPLFTMASAVVTDIGGPLSHSSIVAREYGIPAVLATGIGTRRIHDGQIITVDGSAGIVSLN